MSGVPKSVKEKAIAKWTRGLNACISICTFVDWWHSEGVKHCSFCYYFVNDDGQIDCDKCILARGDNCAAEWVDLYHIVSYIENVSDTKFTISDIEELVKSMLVRLEAIEVLEEI